MRRLLAFEAAALWTALLALVWRRGAPAESLAEATLCASCLLVASCFAGAYEPDARRSLGAALRACLVSLPIGLALVALCPRLFGARPGAGTLQSCALAAPLPLLLARGLLRIGSRRERVLLLGVSPLAVQLIHEWQRRRTPQDLLGVVEDDLRLLEALPLRVGYLGRLDELGRILHETRPDRVVVALQARRGRLPSHLLLKARLRGVVVEEGLQAYERLLGKIAIETISPSVLAFADAFSESPLEARLARLLSLLVAGCGLLLLSPALLVVSLAVVLDSKGSPFFLHERMGARGRRFQLIKFRTMRAAQGAVSEWERDNHERITRVGRVLRRFRIDELPQLVNVLSGDMNLVGPRPHPVSNYELFSRKIPYYWIRGSVRPGITGWAQVRYGYANGLEEETEKMRFDLYYIKHRSLALDLRVLLETFGVVLLGRDASAARPQGNVVRLDVRAAARKATGSARVVLRTGSRAGGSRA